MWASGQAIVGGCSSLAHTGLEEAVLESPATPWRARKRGPEGVQSVQRGVSTEAVPEPVVDAARTGCARLESASGPGVLLLVLTAGTSSGSKWLLRTPVWCFATQMQARVQRQR